METADLTHHISRRFNEDLEKVRNQVLQMGGFVEQQLHKRSEERRVGKEC